MLSPRTSVPEERRPPPFPSDSTRSWVDSNILKNMQCIAFNIFFEMDRAPLAVAAFVNVPLRFGNILQASHNGAYWQIGLDALAITSLLFSEGTQVAIALDVVSGAISAYGNMFPSANEKLYDRQPKDCSTLKASLEVLGLSEEAARDRATVERRYEELCGQWDQRISRSGSSEPLLQRFRRLKYEAVQAHATVCLYIDQGERRN